MTLNKGHSDYFFEDIIAALERVTDHSGDILFKSVQLLQEVRPEDEGYLPPKPEDCPCAIVVFEGIGDTISPAVQAVYAEYMIRASYYICHHAQQTPDVAPNLMLNRMMERTWDFVDEQTDDNPNGIIPSSITGGTAHHWDYETDEMPRPQFENVNEIRGQKVSIPLETKSGIWARRVALPPARIIPESIRPV